MNFPIDFHLGALVIDSHLVFEILAYFIGFRLYLHLRTKITDKISAEDRLWIIIGAIFGAALFSKLLGLLEHPELMILSQQDFKYLLASKTIVGGLLGGLLGVEMVKKLLKIQHSSGDLFCFPIIVGMIIGRIGCFLAGIEDGTHGLPTNFILGMDLGDGLKRHPTALYEISFLILLGLSLVFIKQKVVLAEGALFQSFMVMYLGWRFGIEWIKPVYHYEPLGLSAIQMACGFGLLYYNQLILHPSRFLQKNGD